MSKPNPAIQHLSGSLRVIFQYRATGDSPITFLVETHLGEYLQSEVIREYPRSTPQHIRHEIATQCYIAAAQALQRLDYITALASPRHK